MRISATMASISSLRCAGVPAAMRGAQVVSFMVPLSKAVRGGYRSNPVDRSKPGSKIHVLSDHTSWPTWTACPQA